MQAMSARSSITRLLGRALMAFGALFVVTVLLAAMPGHTPPAEQPRGRQSAGAPASEMAGMDHNQSGVDHRADEASERAAVSEMAHMHGDGPHLHMTALRPQNPADLERAERIVSDLRSGIEKYRDYHAALDDGYRIFLPEIPQPEYHFTSYKNGFLAAMRFDPSAPTSLLYRKTAEGYQLVGAMYTMPKRSTEDQLNDRVPLSVAKWHLHTNLCMPPKTQGSKADWSKFGLKGSISTEEACDAAGGTFHPSVFGWMVHVYPYQDSIEKAFAAHRHD
jgi:hypothetical protein